MKSPHRKTIYGPPGTGKTTYILKLLEEDLKKHDPDKIAFVSFTNKGVNEGRDRAMEKFSMKKKEVPYFGTIHSLCFRALGMSRTNMLNKNHYRLFSEKTGINFCGHYTEDYSSPNDAYLHAVEMKRQNLVTHDNMLTDMKLNAVKYEFIETEVGRMKEQLNLKDFTDILTDYLRDGQAIPVEIAYIDEAQDLTFLQWQVIEKMFSETERIVIAGDDDQAIYEWAGASVRKFITFSEEKIILDKSYRMPIVIHELARKIVSDIEFRQEKVLSPKAENGVLAYENTLKNVDLEGGEMILARTKYVLRELSRILMEDGYLFSFKGKSSVNITVLSAIMAYQQYVKGEIDELRPAYEALFETVRKDVDWYDVLKQSETVKDYYRRVLDTKAYQRKSIIMETFHGSKGAENSHVILATDTSRKVENMRHLYPDMELRCLFVAVTRSSNKLTVLKPTRQYHCPMQYLTTT